MKTTKRFIAMAAALTLTACAAMPMSIMTVSATEVSINTSKDKATHTYSAYQIFKATYDADLGLTITGYGEGYNGAGLAGDTAFKALSIGNDQTVGSFLGDKTDAATVAQAIEKLNYANDTANTDALAAILQKYITNNATATALSNNAVDLAAGYWIVLDTYTSNTTQDAISKYVLKISGGSEAITITPKKDYPNVVKKVQENTGVDDYSYTVGTTTVTDEDYNDVADYNIGDDVPFKLYGTMPSTYDDYNHYYYSFTDTLGSEFTMPAATGVTVKVVNPDGDDEGTAADVATLTAGTDYTISIEGNVLTVTFMDTKKVASISANSVITVEYEATLNSNAKVGLPGQENKVDLEYSNNPNKTGDGSSKPEDTDKTPEDKVIVFTYEQDIKKIDAATGTELKDAEFILFREVSGVNQYAIVSNNKLTGWTTTEDDATVLKTDDNGICKVIGLDDGTYKLKEKKAPTDYNPINNVMVLAIDATTVNGQNWDGTASSALTEIKLSTSGDTHISDITGQLSGAAKNNKGTVQAQITNEKGINLPETGGIGTTLFILGGGCAAGIAGIYLISKKKTREEE